MAEPLAKRPQKHAFSLAEKLWYLDKKAELSLCIQWLYLLTALWPKTATKKMSAATSHPQYRLSKRFKPSKNWTYNLTQTCAYSARRKSHSCRVWHRKLSHSGPIGKFRAHYPSLVSPACCKTMLWETIRIVFGFFHFFRNIGSFNRFCEPYVMVKHTTNAVQLLHLEVQNQDRNTV